MSYSERVNQIRRAAEGSNHYDYTGGKGQYFGYIGRAPQYFGVAGDTPNQLDAYSTILTAQISNTTTAVVSNVDLFNAIEDPTDALLSGSILITIAQGSTHVRIKSEIVSNPWWIDGMKCRVSASANQFNNALTLRRLEGTGETTTAIWDLAAGLSSIQNQATRVEHPNFRFLLDGYNNIRFNLNGSEILTFVFNLRKKVYLANSGRGMNVVKTSDSFLPTGDPRFDTQVAAGMGTM